MNFKPKITYKKKTSLAIILIFVSFIATLQTGQALHDSTQIFFLAHTLPRTEYTGIHASFQGKIYAVSATEPDMQSTGIRITKVSIREQDQTWVDHVVPLFAPTHGPRGVWAASNLTAFFFCDCQGLLDNFGFFTQNGGIQFFQWDAPTGTKYADVWGFGANQVYALVREIATGEVEVHVWNISTQTFALEATLGVFNNARTIFGVTSSDMWAVAGTQLKHKTGGNWVDVVEPTSDIPTAIWGNSVNDVWFGMGTATNNVMWHWDGTTLSSVSIVSGGQFFSMHGFSANDIWATRGAQVVPTDGSIIHFDGTSWTLENQEFPNHVIDDVYVDGPGGFGPTGINTAWIVGSTSTLPRDGFIWRWQAIPSDDFPKPATADSTVTCPSALTIRGVWLKGSAQTQNTFVRFVIVEGQSPSGDTDLRNNLGAISTTLIDDGTAANGDHSEIVTYNNAVGNSYQFFARNGLTGPEQLGQIVFSPQNQCEPIFSPEIQTFIHNPNDFNIWISQAQCNGDKTAFTLNFASVGTLVNLNVSIIDTETDIVTLIVDDNEMFNKQTSNGNTFYFNRTLSPGPWTALALADTTGAGAVDLFDNKAFNVPINDCAGTGEATNLTAVLEAIAQLRNIVIGGQDGQNSTLANLDADHDTQGLYAHCGETRNIDCEGIKPIIIDGHNGQNITLGNLDADHDAQGLYLHCGELRNVDCEGIKTTMTTQHALQDLTHGAAGVANLESQLATHDANQTSHHTQQGLYLHCGETRTIECESIRNDLATHDLSMDTSHQGQDAQFVSIRNEHVTQGLFIHHSQTTADIHDTNQTSEHTQQGLYAHCGETRNIECEGIKQQMTDHDLKMTQEHTLQGLFPHGNITIAENLTGFNDTLHDLQAQIEIFDTDIGEALGSFFWLALILAAMWTYFRLEYPNSAFYPLMLGTFAAFWAMVIFEPLIFRFIGMLTGVAVCTFALTRIRVKKLEEKMKKRREEEGF